MRSLPSSLVSVLTGLLFLLAAPSAWAGSILIDFDLSGSSVSLLGGLLQIPSDGTITAASARISVPGSDATTPTPGAAQLSSLQLVGTIDGTVGGSVGITGDFAANQNGVAPADLANDLATLSLASLVVELDGSLDCVGGQCVALGTFPASAVDLLLDLINLEPFMLAGLDAVGAGTLSGVLPFSLGGNDVLATLIGQESGRSFVPEPASGVLLSLGLLACLGVGSRRS